MRRTGRALSLAAARALTALAVLALALTVLALTVLAPSPAAAHGREPHIGLVAFDPVDRDHLVLRGTWALLTTRDGGETFTWSCAVAAGFDRLTEDPPVVVTASGAIALGTFDGLRRSTASGCDYEDGPAPVRGAYVIDAQPDPHDPRAIWAVSSPGDRPNTILRSGDEGASFETLASFDPGVLLERVRLAASDPLRVYASGAIPMTATEPRRAFLFRSVDGGRTFVSTEIPLLTADERNVHVVAVDPTDAQRALVRVTRRATDPLPERLLLTEDGGDSFRAVLEERELVAVAFSHDGAHVWAGSWDGGLHRSDDGGETFASLDAELRVRCLAERAALDGTSELFVCADELTEDFALARSRDLGETLEPVWGFADATNDVGCPACTAVRTICPSYWPDVVYDLALLGGVDGGPAPGPVDGGVPPFCGEGGVSLDASLDASTESGGPGGGCGCAVVGARGPRGALGARVLHVIAMASLALLLARRCQSR